MSTYAKRSYSGGARTLTLAATINSTTTSFSATGTFLTWPMGSTGPFVLCLTRGTATEEKVTCAAFNHSTGVFSTAVRGFDGTSARGHVHGSSQTISLVWSAYEAQEANRAAVAIPGLFTAGGDLVVAAGLHTAKVLHAGNVGQVLEVQSTGGGKKLGYGTKTTTTYPAGRLYITDETIVETETVQIGHMVATFLVGGMELATNALVVPTTGVYFLSAFIGYQSSDSHPSAGDYWTHVYVDGTEKRRWQMAYTNDTYVNPQPGGSDLIKLTGGSSVALYGHTLNVAAAASTAEYPTTWLSLKFEVAT